jgi:hypothetical protein
MQYFESDNGKIEMKINFDFWHHDSVNGLVKESFTMKAPSWGGNGGGDDLKGTSALKSYSAKKK